LGALWWWTACIAALVGVYGVFGFAPHTSELWTYIAPVVVCALLCARRAAARGVHASLSAIALDTTAVMAGFLAINVPWIGYYATRVPAALLLREVLFVGSGYAQFFYRAHPAALRTAFALTVAMLAFAALPSRLKSWVHRPAPLLVAFAAVALVIVGAVVSRRPMVEGFASSVTTAFESFWVYPVTLAIHWLAIAACWREVAVRRSERDGGSSTSSSGDAFLVATVGSVFFYLQTYPRTDIMHWVTAASLPVGLAFGLAGVGTRLWAEEDGPALRRAVFALSAAPLVLVCALRIEGSLSTVFRWDGSGFERRATVELAAARAPVWMNIGKAERYRDIDRLVQLLDRCRSPTTEC
jgi:hypothetical protein